MLTSSQISRSAAVAIAIASLGAGTAVARPADDAVVTSSGPVVSARVADDLRSPDAVDAASTPARHEGLGVTRVSGDLRSPDAVDAAGRVAVRPPARHEGLGVTPAAPAPVVSDVPAAPLTVADDSGGIDWLSVALGAAALLALLLTGTLLRNHHPRVPRVRPRAS